MHQRMKELFPINRSITGEGVVETLSYIKKILPKLKVKKIRSGTRVHDWTIPEEWNLVEGYIQDKEGRKIISSKINNLHIIGYSEEVEGWLSREELMNNIYTIKEMPDAIPYVTSYYNKRWGFCMTEYQRQAMKDDIYYAKIKSRKTKGYLHYADLIKRGKSKEEVLISTYICHPSMANNELSGPMVATRLAEILSKENTYYTYRFVFIPETIGSIAYTSRNLKRLKKRTKAGFVLTCIGDNNGYSFLKTKYENTLSDKVAMSVIRDEYQDAQIYKWETRGSDERQYCSPGIDLPIASIMRTKYGEYKEYHTSKDNLEYVSAEGLQGGLEYVLRIIDRLETNGIPASNVKGEPQLGRRGLYPEVSTKNSYNANVICDLLSYSDGANDMIDIKERTGHEYASLVEAFQLLEKNMLIRDLRGSKWISNTMVKFKEFWG
tara:strand:+ start:1215 stop:2522 length:1308 start_codon:yes stop_codon:yes gene_type:complete